MGEKQFDSTGLPEQVNRIWTVRLALLGPQDAGGESRFRAFWTEALRDVGKGHVVLLDFRDVGMLSSLFLVSLLQAHREVSRRGGCFISFGIDESLLRLFRVTGLSIPLETVLHVVPDEDEALARAKAFSERYGQ